MNEKRTFLTVIKNIVTVIIKIYVGLLALTALWNGSGGIILILIIAIASLSGDFNDAMNFMSGPIMSSIFMILKLGISIYGSRLMWLALQKKHKTTKTQKWVLSFLLLICAIGWAVSVGLKNY